MAWRIEFEAGALKDPRGLDRHVARRITQFLRTRVGTMDEGMGVYEAAKKMQISYRAAKRRYELWQGAGGENRVKRQLDGEATLTR